MNSGLSRFLTAFCLTKIKVNDIIKTQVLFRSWCKKIWKSLDYTIFLCYSILTSEKKGLIFLCQFLREAKFTAISEVPLMRVKVTLACTECKQRNYNTMKNKKNDPDRLEMKKHCRFCNKHTLHKETK